MIRACLLAEEAYIAAVIGKSDIAGITLWFPPGKSLWDRSGMIIVRTT
jgi:hypothetical protein